MHESLNMHLFENVCVYQCMYMQADTISFPFLINYERKPEKKRRNSIVVW